MIREMFKSDTFLLHDLVYDQTQFLKPTSRRQNMRYNEPRKSRVTKPIHIPQREEEAQSKLRVLDSQRIDNQIYLILIQPREDRLEVIPAKKTSQTEALQTGDDFRDRVYGVSSRNRRIAIVGDLRGRDGGFSEDEESQGRENAGVLGEKERLFPSANVTEHRNLEFGGFQW